jgi:hypothetical protein
MCAVPDQRRGYPPLLVPVLVCLAWAGEMSASEIVNLVVNPGYGTADPADAARPPGTCRKSAARPVSAGR